MGRELPILFSGEMVRAILAGAKTQTRRLNLKRYEVGDRLWVREAWRTSAELDKSNAKQVAALATEAGWEQPWAPMLYLADGQRSNWEGREWGEPGRYRHARFMPRWASRITLEVTDVRVQRLQEISEDDARAEGVELHPEPSATTPYRSAFIRLWEQKNGKRATWESNPWVWAITFRRLP